MTLTKEWLELSNDGKYGCFEGTSHTEPTDKEIRKLVVKRGYVADDISIFFDKYQFIYRFNGHLKNN